MTGPSLVEFLTARLDEDEAVARDVPKSYVSGNWIVEDTFYEGMILVDRHGVAEENETTRHMTRWSPARVLADVKAKRAIVELHESWPVMVQTPPEMTRVDPSDVTSMTFRMSQQIAWLTTQEYRARFGDEPPSSPMLRALASVYADHPDYDATWAP